MASDKGKKSAKTVTAIPANDDGTEKKRALDIALAGIEKQFGKGAVMRGTSYKEKARGLERTHLVGGHNA